MSRIGWLRSLAADPDVGRRVVQCVECSRASTWTGRENAVRAGWGSRWQNERHEWLCPSCWTPAPAAAPAVAAALPWVADRVRRCLRASPRTRREREALIDLLLRTAEERPTQCALTLATIAPVLKGRRGPGAKWWREQLVRVRRLLGPADAPAADRTLSMFEGIAPPPVAATSPVTRRRSAA